MVKNPPSNAGDEGSIPTKIPRAGGQVSPCTTTTEPACSRSRVPPALSCNYRKPACCNKDPAQLKKNFKREREKKKAKFVRRKRHREMNTYKLRGSVSIAQMVKNLPAMQKTGAQPLGQEDPRRRKWQPTPVVLPGESHGQGSLAGYSPWGHKELDMTK